MGCATNTTRSPLRVDTGSEAGAAGASEQEGGLNVGPDAGDPTLGGPCADDTQCADGIDCTTDSCDATMQRCRHVPNDAPCGDGVYCNGEEVCDPRLGCGAGSPVSCADADPCTIDTCVELTHSCSRAPRDADGDGDPVWNCVGGGDCDDTNPDVSSKTKEVCGNGIDDNCNGEIDEKGCVVPAHDTCAKALVIAESGFTSLSLAATKLDYPTSCAPADKQLGDVVVALTVPVGDPQDVDLVAEANTDLVSLATANACGKTRGLACAASIARKQGALSRLRLHGLTPGVYPIYVAASPAADVALSVTYSAATAPPANETCGTAQPLVPGKSETAALVGVNEDLTSACKTEVGELVYSFSLDQPEDVRVFASPLDRNGAPQLSLRDASCKAASSELTCRNGTPSAELFARALPAGQYYLSVGASGPSDVDVRLEESPPTVAPPDEGCAEPPTIALGVTEDLVLADHADAVDVGCLAGAPDSSHTVTLTETSDVLLVERFSKDDTGAVSLSLPACQKQSQLACGSSTQSPVRASAFAVPKGSYRAVAESAAGNPVSLTVLTRKAAPATLVTQGDDCSAPFEVPASGGRFKGNTANAHADFSAGCDLGNQGKNGAADQILHLALSAPSRVVLDMSGSAYETMLSVRSGATCPGTELPLSCAAGYLSERSFLDLDLASGDYYIQVDGYGGDAGAWSLDIYVTPNAI